MTATIDKKIRSNVRVRQFGRPGRLASSPLVTGKPNYLYVDFLDGAPPVACFNPSLPPVPGLHVTVRPINGRRTIIEDRNTYTDDYSYALMKYHGPNHTWPNFDASPIHLRQFLPGLVTASGLTITVQQDWIFTSQGLVNFPGGTVSIASSVPVTGARYVLITISDVGILTVTEGTAVDYASLNFTDIPPVPDGHKMEAIIRLVAGQTNIRDTLINSDIIDPRFSGNPAELNNKVPYAQQQDTKDPSGWLDPGGIDVAYNSTDRTITLTGDLTFYWRGIKTVLTSPWVSSAHDAADGNYYLYTTDGDTFAWSTTPWAFSDLMVAKATKSTSPAYQFAIRETHGLMPWQVHQELHANISAYRESGGDLDPATYMVNTASDAATTPGFVAASIRDEDLSTIIDAWAQGAYTTLRIGASSKATFDTTATFPFRSSGSYILLNNPNTGAETAAANNQYVNVYQILVPAASDAGSQAYRILMLQPQAAYASLAAAKAEDPRQLVLGDLSTTSPEFVLYARITYVLSAGDANTGKCRIASDGISYLAGSRLSQVSVSGFTAPTAENIPFTPGGGISAINVQAALQELDTEKAPLASPALTGNPTAPTPAVSDNDTSIATTAYVMAQRGDIPSGATLPASPLANQLFIHTPTGRRVLMIYTGAAWYPMFAFGASTIYVDTTNGTDAQDKGGGVTTNAYKTIQYAINGIPKAGNNANWVINVASGTYVETLTFTNVKPGDLQNGTIRIIGSETEIVAAATPSAVAQCSNTALATLTFSGAGLTVNAHSGQWAKCVTGSNAAGTYSFRYYKILSNTSDTLTLAGKLFSTPLVTDTWSIVDAGVTISPASGRAVWIQNSFIELILLKFSAASIGIQVTKWSQARLYVCNLTASAAFAATLFVENGSNAWVVASEITNTNANFGYGVMAQSSVVEFGNSIIRKPSGGTNSYGIILLNNSTGRLTYSTQGTNNILDGWVYGIDAQANSVMNCDTSGAFSNKIQNNTTALYARTGGKIVITTNNYYTGNTTDENAVAASYGYID